MRAMLVVFGLAAAMVALAQEPEASPVLGVATTRGSHPSVRLVALKVSVDLSRQAVRAEHTFLNEGTSTEVPITFHGVDLPAAHQPRMSISVAGKPAKLDGLRVRIRSGETVHVVSEFPGWPSTGKPMPDGVHTLIYQLKPAAAWKGGKIGKLSLELNAKGKHAPILLRPGVWNSEQGIYQWEASDFAPTEDLNVVWFEGATPFTINGVPGADLLKRATGYGSEQPPIRDGADILVPVRTLVQILGVQLHLGPPRIVWGSRKLDPWVLKGTRIQNGRMYVSLPLLAARIGGNAAWYTDGLRVRVPEIPKP